MNQSSMVKLEAIPSFCGLLTGLAYLSYQLSVSYFAL